MPRADLEPESLVSEDLTRHSPEFSLVEGREEPLFLPDPSDADGLTPWRRSVTPFELNRFDETNVSQTPPPRPRFRRAPALVRVDSPLPRLEREPELLEGVRSAPAGPRRIRLLPPRPAPSTVSIWLI